MDLAQANTIIDITPLLYFFLFLFSGGWGKQSVSSPRFHAFSFTWCVDLTQFHWQSSVCWRVARPSIAVIAMGLAHATTTDSIPLLSCFALRVYTAGALIRISPARKSARHSIIRANKKLRSFFSDVGVELDDP